MVGEAKPKPFKIFPGLLWNFEHASRGVSCNDPYMLNRWHQAVPLSGIEANNLAFNADL